MTHHQIQGDAGWVSVVNSRTGRHPGYSYKLIGGGGQQQFGLDIIAAGTPEVDEGKMMAVIPYADGARRDGVGDLLEVGGINVERHRANPVVLFDHGKAISLPIALAQDPDTGEYANVIDPMSKTARVKAYFYRGHGTNGLERGKEYEHALFCEQLFDLWAKRYVRAGSIGYSVIHAKQLSPDYDRGTPEGLHLLAVLMLEASAVVMPANMDTVRKVLSMDRVCGKALSPVLVKSLSAYAPEQTKTVVGFAGTVAVPLNEDLSETNVPPARWRPGVGAEKMKALRQKYKAQPKMERWAVYVNGKFWGNEWAKSKDEVIDVVKASINDPSVRTEARGPYRGPETKAQPSDKIDPKKACQIIKDGEANGKPLTEAQEGMFGAACGRKSLALWTVTDQGGRRVGQFRATDEQDALRQAASSFQYGGNASGLKAEKESSSVYRIECEWKDKTAHFEIEAIDKAEASELARKEVKKKTGLPVSSIARVIYLRDSKSLDIRKSVKELRQQYGKKAWLDEPSLDVSKITPKPNPNDPTSRSGFGRVAGGRRGYGLDYTLQPGERVVARRTIYDHGEGGTQIFCKAGESLWIVEESSKDLFTCRNKEGKIRKDLSPYRDIRGLSGRKSLDLRAKYRPTKRLRRRLKRSTPGSSVVYIAAKDLDALRGEAKSRGLKATPLGTSGNHEKVKLSGDDEVIDELAKKFGRSMSRKKITT